MHRTVLLALACATACASPPEVSIELEEIRTPGDGGRAPEVHLVSLGDEPDLCELLPACPPCSDACDPGALAGHIPPGTCAAFVCELVDGRDMTFHACHHE